jgi:uncharacterized protein (TIGR02284 family)
MSTDVAKLQTLTDTAIDSVKGYQSAAQRAKHPSLVQRLSEQANKRQETVNMLNAEITRLGGEPRSQGSASGAVHRAWTGLADAVGDSDENAAERVEEGEDYIADKFEEAIEKGNLSPASLEVVRKAYTEIKQGERLTDALEDAYD